MRNPQSQQVDIDLSKAIARYITMNVDQALDAIEAEWPPQIAALLYEVFFKTTWGGCFDITEFMEFERDDDPTSYFIPICTCDEKDGGLI